MTFGQLEHLLGIDRRLGGLRAGVARLRFHCKSNVVFTPSATIVASFDLVLASAHADPCRTVFRELLDGDAQMYSARRVSTLEGPATGRRGARGIKWSPCPLRLRTVQSTVYGAEHERDALLGDLLLLEQPRTAGRGTPSSAECGKCARRSYSSPPAKFAALSTTRVDLPAFT